MFQDLVLVMQESKAKGRREGGVRVSSEGLAFQMEAVQA